MAMSRGPVVAAVSPDEIMQLFETRAVLEKYMLREAIPNTTNDHLRRSEEILVQYEQSLERDLELSYGDAGTGVSFGIVCTCQPSCEDALFEYSEHAMRPVYPSSSGRYA
jgi:hypothetical protein